MLVLAVALLLVVGNGLTVVMFDVFPLKRDLNTVEMVLNAGSSPFSPFSSWIISFIVL